MTAAKLEAAACAMRARNAATRQPIKPKPVQSSPEGPIDTLRAGLEYLAAAKMPYDVVMHEVARLYVRSAVKIHGSHTKAAKAISAHRNTLHRVERER